MKYKTRVHHWMGDKKLPLPLLSDSEGFYVEYSLDEFYWVIERLSIYFDVMIKRVDMLPVIHIDDRGKSFKQR
jgi:hypothetical protein